MKNKNNEEININDAASKKKGLFKIIENIMRKVPNGGMLFVSIFILALYVFCMGVALTPGILVFLKVQSLTSNSSEFIRALGMAMSIGLGLFLFSFTIIFVVPLVNYPFIPFVRSYRGPWFSLESIPWYIHNALIYLVRYTILDLITPSPLNILFYRMMGMKIGKGVMINTSNISDACLIELEDYAVIGGSASLMAHYGMKGYLIIDRLKIGRGSTIGLNAIIMGGVIIGEKVTMAPGSVALPKTIIPDETKFGL
ncbi:MAG: hypothetical protein HN576_14625 [Bacteriovoracaceae bacterium]|jgi:NDP-sugar pyrophosphorylase family protein|nr:hypothetical protein [Bacteriovoracaceae bacterium]